MLTKDLILCRANRGNLVPQFVNHDDPRLTAIAERLIDVFRQTPPPTRGDIAKNAAEIAAAGRHAKVARGLEKLLLDRSEFDHAADIDYAELRRTVLRRAADVLKQAGLTGVGKYRDAVLAGAEIDDADAHSTELDLYADLPENETLATFRDLTPRQLLERYNVGLVQALLLRAGTLRADVNSPDPARMRRLFKYLKFFRLLVRVTVLGGQDDSRSTPDTGLPRRVRLTVDGPTSLFDQPRRYGLQLASFFPALCTLEQWNLNAEVEWRGKMCRLCLDEQSGLVSHYRHFGAYVPEEVRLFERHFRESVTTWKLVDQRPYLQIHGQDLAFPDFAFADAGGHIVHLELFHRWHAGPLRERLAALADHTELPLVLGIDRALLERDETARAVEQSGLLEHRAFLFRDYPTVSRTLACLDEAADIIRTQT